MRTFIMQHAVRDSLPIVARRFRFHKQTKSDRVQVSTGDERNGHNFHFQHYSSISWRSILSVAPKNKSEEFEDTSTTYFRMLEGGCARP